MIRLFVIADDFTGALDTGVQFASYGSPTTVIVVHDGTTCINFPDTQVLVVDAETRHLSAQDAYQRTYFLVQQAVQNAVPCIYIKTDSALRGNIGAQFDAALAASGQSRLHFVPAFPQMHRTTKEGIHYVENIPVAESIFGQDPFEPVTESYIPNLIALQSSRPCTCLSSPPQGEIPNGILIYDASTNHDLREIAESLAQSNELHLIAGCAGLASTLPHLLGLSGTKSEGHVRLSEQLLVACGSINPVSQRQCLLAEQHGVPRFRLTSSQRLMKGWADSPDASDLLRQLNNACQDHSIVIVDVGDPGSDTHENQKDNRALIAENFGCLIKRLLDQKLPSLLFVMGGDTLLGAMQQADIFTIEPLCEVVAGIVLSRFVYKGEIRYLLSKSGGFGQENLFTELQQTLSRWNEECACHESVTSFNR